VIEVPPTIALLPFHTSGKFPKPDLIGRCDAQGITSTSGHDLLDRVRDLSLGLTALGMRAGERVMLLSESRPEWLFADLAILCAGAVTTPVYPTLSVEQVRMILQDSSASFAIVSTPDQLTKVLDAAAGLDHLRAVITIDRFTEAGAPTRPEVLAMDDVAAHGHKRLLDGWGIAREFHDRARQVRPEDPATLIYTSGTTGIAKGVLLSHHNLASNLAGLSQVLDLHEEDVALSFLPLCHAFERIVSYVYLTYGVSVVFAESVDTVARDLLRVRPTVMTGVPRVFEKLQARIFAVGREEAGVRRAIFEWGMQVAARRGERLPEGRPLGPVLAIQSRLADALVFKRVKERVGGRLRYAVSGGAPLRPAVGRFFYGLGIPILEGYGLTETSPVLCVMPLRRVRFGTVGPPLPNVEIRIAEDGEILARGPSIMAGYYQRPDETAAAIRDGWFHTGDIGALDEAGYLRITDRKKEVLVTSGGKKIAPQAIEHALKASGVVEEAVLIADGRHFPVALLVPNFVEIGRRLGRTVPGDHADAESLVQQPDVVAWFQAAVDAANAPLAQFERIGRFAILSVQFGVGTGELTPTLKVKRRVVEERYRDVIERLYARP
jgi:long-chain acyl-CoA synthetase